MMKSEKNNNHILKTISHVILEGSPYEIGKKQGDVIKDNEKAMKYFASGAFNPEKSGFKSHSDIVEFYDQYIPGISEEFQGFADALEISIENIVPYDYPYSMVSQCSHLALLPKITQDNHVYATRTYDWHYDDEDMRLLTTKVDGKYEHIGFSTLLAGRTDGLNSKGLCVTMAGGGAWDATTKNKRAFNYAFAIRSILDNCKSTKEALKLIEEIPVNTSTHFLFVDKSGHAAIIENFDCEYDIREIDEESDKQYLYSTNYYESDKMKHLNEFVNYYLKKMNPAREAVFNNFLNNNMPNIQKSDLISLLEKNLPKGLSTPFYSEWFGNLWSIVFDVTNGELNINMGTASENPWRKFTLDAKHEEKEYEVIYKDMKSGFA